MEEWRVEEMAHKQRVMRNPGRNPSHSMSTARPSSFKHIAVTTGHELMNVSTNCVAWMFPCQSLADFGQVASEDVGDLPVKIEFEVQLDWGEAAVLKN